jgi:hypothetical protein
MGVSEDDVWLIAEGPRYQAAEPHSFWQRVEDNAFHLRAKEDVIS